MARQTAIRVTASSAIAAHGDATGDPIANVALDEYKRDERRDEWQNAEDRRALSTSEFLAKLRASQRDDGLDDDARARALMGRAYDAARLSMRGDMYDAEDRRDCAAEVVWSVLAKMPGGVAPSTLDGRFDLSALRGMAQNFRRGLDRRRAAEQRAQDESENRRATTWHTALDALNLDHLADDEREARDIAADAADAACERLGVPKGMAVWSLLYRWARDVDGSQCARELGVSDKAWEHRMSRGASALFALTTGDALKLIGLLVGYDVGRASDGAVTYSRPEITTDEPYRKPGKLTPSPREHTSPQRVWNRDKQGHELIVTKPELPVDADAARASCRLKHQCPTPGLKAAGKSLARRGRWQAVTVTADGRRMYYRQSGASEAQRRADALRSIARLSVRPGARERAVHYHPNHAQ